MFQDGAESEIGAAGYVVREDGSAAEFALVVADHWQGKGIGATLLDRIERIARNRGVPALEGDVLYDKQPMLALARKLGFGVKVHPEDARLMLVSKSVQQAALARAA